MPAEPLDHPQPITRLEQILCRQAARRGAHPALVCGEARMTYDELERASRLLATELALRWGVAVGDRVGLFCAKGVSAVVGLFGVLRAGAVYVPLDPTGPLDRMLRICRQCGIKVLLATVPQARRLAAAPEPPAGPERLLVLRDAGAGPPAPPLPERVGSLAVETHAILGAPPPERLREVPAGHAVAYILYTSGSTGEPKGVTISHRASLFFVRWAAREVGLSEDDRAGNHAPLYFDLSTFDLFSTLLCGGTVVIVPPALSAFPTSLAAYIERQGITVWYSVPSVLVDLLERGNLGARDLGKLRTVIYAGEPFPVKPLRELMQRLPQARLHNWFGPTETNVCTAYALPGPPDLEAAAVPIGRVCEGLEGLLVDDEGKPVPAGERGELLIRGDCLMEGYFGQPELSASRFLDRGDGGPWYRTGDIMHEDAQGVLHFAGRRDSMVKVRGYRIELGEVESAIRKAFGIEEVCAVTHRTADEENHLVAFVRGTSRSGGEILDGLRERLPGYMIPERVIPLEEFPRTGTGKVDRQGLARKAQEG